MSQDNRKLNKISVALEGNLADVYRLRAAATVLNLLNNGVMPKYLCYIVGY
jgi:hypothetical protein